jgi:hypothetical protein
VKLRETKKFYTRITTQTFLKARLVEKRAMYSYKIGMAPNGEENSNNHSDTSSSSQTSLSQAATQSDGSVTVDTLPEWHSLGNELGTKFRILRRTDQIEELQTRLRDAETSRSDFKFVADRLIRMVIEEGLNQLRKLVEKKIFFPNLDTILNCFVKRRAHFWRKAGL